LRGIQAILLLSGDRDLTLWLQNLHIFFIYLLKQINFILLFKLNMILSFLR